MQNAPVPLLRPFAVTIHQCSCGYASIYKQKVARHVETCGGCPSVLERTVPADGSQPARSPSSAARSRPADGGRRVARGSAEERDAWAALLGDDRVMNYAHTLSADRACVLFFEELQKRTRTARVRGINVYEYQGNGSETVTTMSRFRVQAALDIAQHFSVMKDSAAATEDPRVGKLVAAFTNIIEDEHDDDGVEMSWEDLLLAKSHRTPLTGVAMDTRTALASVLRDIEAIACRESA